MTKEQETIAKMAATIVTGLIPPDILRHPQHTASIMLQISVTATDVAMRIAEIVKKQVPAHASTTPVQMPLPPEAP